LYTGPMVTRAVAASKVKRIENQPGTPKCFCLSWDHILICFTAQMIQPEDRRVRRGVQILFSRVVQNADWASDIFVAVMPFSTASPAGMSRIQWSLYDGLDVMCDAL